MTSLFERVAERIPQIGVRLAYGETAEVAGEPLLPVAFVVYGFGAGEGEGSGTSKADDEPGGFSGSGSGGGGGGVSIPVGAYVRRGGRLAFRPNPVALLIFGVPFATAVGVGIAAIIRAAR
ncbi:MAG: hypothetical protein J7480_07010 [Microbacteriaceae bacterium]|nr:hypothetical protein [Microbacteriaceae bacterium]